MLEFLGPSIPSLWLSFECQLGFRRGRRFPVLMLMLEQCEALVRTMASEESSDQSSHQKLRSSPVWSRSWYK